MRHTLSSSPVRLVLAAVLAATLAACGQSGGSADADSASEPTTSTTVSEEAPQPGDSASATGGEGAPSTGGGALLVAGDTPTTTTARIISASNAQGEVAARPAPLGGPAALRELVAPLGDDLGTQVRAAVRQTEVPDGQTLMGAVVSLGCDLPTAIELVQTFDGYEVTGVVPKSGVQCLVPVTSVALFLVENP